jgi:hypothetical protein
LQRLLPALPRRHFNVKDARDGSHEPLGDGLGLGLVAVRALQLRDQRHEQSVEHIGQALNKVKRGGGISAKQHLVGPKTGLLTRSFPDSKKDVRTDFLSLIWSLLDQSFDPSLKFPMKAFYTFGLLVVGWGFSHLDAQDQEPLNHLGVLAKTHATLLTKFPLSCVMRSL